VHSNLWASLFHHNYQEFPEFVCRRYARPALTEVPFVGQPSIPAASNYQQKKTSCTTIAEYVIAKSCTSIASTPNGKDTALTSAFKKNP